MMNAAAQVAELMQSPELPLVVRELNEALASERVRRERFREELTGSEKAEFINGKVLVHSPAKKRHLQATGHLFGLLQAHVNHARLGYAASEKALVCLTRNDYEPDICFFGPEKAAALAEDQMKFPAPDFIVEVLSESTEATDRTVKFRDYARHGVREYWLIDAEQETIEQYELAQEEYRLRLKLAAGSIRSLVVPGFEIAVRAIFNAQENLQALRKIVAE